MKKILVVLALIMGLTSLYINLNNDPDPLVILTEVPLSQATTAVDIVLLEQTLSSSRKSKNISTREIQEYTKLLQQARFAIGDTNVEARMRTNIDLGGSEKAPVVVAISSLKKPDIYGIFIHSESAQEPHRAHVLFNVSIARAFSVLDHELVHGAYGQGEFFAYGYSLLTQIHIAASFPAVFLEGKTALNSPFFDYHERLSGLSMRKNLSGDPEKYSHMTALLLWIHDYIQTYPEDEAYKLSIIRARMVEYNETLLRTGVFADEVLLHRLIHMRNKGTLLPEELLRDYHTFVQRAFAGQGLTFPIR